MGIVALKLSHRDARRAPNSGWHAHVPVGTVACALLLGVGAFRNVSAAPTLELVAETTLESTTPLDPRPVGGLSGLAHIEGDRWMAVSDDARSPRAYELEIALNDRGELRATVVAVHDLRADARDAESIARAPDGGWFVGFESPATILHFNDRFENPRELTAARDAGAELQRNKGWESLTVLPSDPPMLLAISELGPAPTADDPQRFWRARAILLNAQTGAWIATEDYPITRPPGFGPTGLVEIEAIDAETIFALQRSLTVGRGYDGAIEFVELTTDGDSTSFRKRSAASLRALGAARIDNVEAMAGGARAADGFMTLMLLSDNNFGRDGQSDTRVIAVRLIPE